MKTEDRCQLMTRPLRTSRRWRRSVLPRRQQRVTIGGKIAYCFQTIGSSLPTWRNAEDRDLSIKRQRYGQVRREGQKIESQGAHRILYLRSNTLLQRLWEGDRNLVLRKLRGRLLCMLQGCLCLSRCHTDLRMVSWLSKAQASPKTKFEKQ